MNMAFSPGNLPEGVFRRSPICSYPGTKARVKRQCRLEAGTDVTCLELDPYTDDGRDGPDDQFPRPLEGDMGILGAQLDPFLSADGHWQTLVHKAQGRMGVLARLARLKWGLDTVVLKMTHDSAVTSLPRYGTCMPRMTQW